MSATKVLRCTCKHEFQDERYGRGKRLHNKLADKATYDWRCTVCANERNV